jgi:hypothetical protein
MGDAMPNTLVLIHGYSDNGKSFATWRIICKTVTGAPSRLPSSTMFRSPMK